MTVTAAIALLVVVAGLAWIFCSPAGADTRHLTALVIVGLAGGVLAGMFPSTACFIIVCVALGGIGMLLGLVPALVAGTLLLAAANLAELLAAAVAHPGFLARGQFSLPGLLGQDIGAGSPGTGWETPGGRSRRCAATSFPGRRCWTASSRRPRRRPASGPS